MRRSLLSLILLICALPLVAANFATDITVNMAVISVDPFSPPSNEVLSRYIVHKSDDGTPRWLFDSFLLDVPRTGAIAYVDGAPGRAANREDWLRLQDAQVNTMARIDSIVAAYKTELGEAPFRHKTVLMLPSPVSTLWNWGNVGFVINFPVVEHRFYALYDYLLSLAGKLPESRFDNLDYIGVAWPEETPTETWSQLDRVFEYAGRSKARIYWLTTASDPADCAENGFAFGYVGNPVNISKAVKMARNRNMGLYADLRLNSAKQLKTLAKLDDCQSVVWQLADSVPSEREAKVVIDRLTVRNQNARYAQSNIRDLALIYQGASHRIDWTEEQFVPYVTHTFADGSREWLFDGFHFLDFTTGVVSFFSTAKDGGSARSDWEWYLNRLFERGKSLDALDKCIETQKKELGDPGFRHKVVLSLPMPLKDKKNWGELYGRALDFSSVADRTDACRWFLQQLVERFDAAGYKNLDLDGIYWLDEEITDNAEVCRNIADEVHARGLRYIWIPYFKAKGYINAYEYGFDIAYMQPNYFFNIDRPDKRLSETCDMVRLLGYGIEFEADETALTDKAERMQAYIDTFDRYGAWRNSAIAHYTGSVLLIEMAKDERAEIRALADDYARRIVNRRAPLGD